MLSDKAEEILETLWISQEKKEGPMSLKGLSESGRSPKDPSSAVGELKKIGLVSALEDGRLSLTAEGMLEATDTVRRHRLAERLLVDVLNMKGRFMHETACQFEHLLHRGIGDRVCLLLGHPKFCPHGHPIPPGRCCERKEPRWKVVSSLSELAPGEGGTIAYIQAGDQKNLQKMMAMGVLPGQPITLQQAFPSYVFKVGNSQFAVDHAIASEIYVRLEDEHRHTAAGSSRGPRRGHFWGSASFLRRRKGKAL